jgi:hypothetical protein
MAVIRIGTEDGKRGEILVSLRTDFFQFGSSSAVCWHLISTAFSVTGDSDGSKEKWKPYFPVDPSPKVVKSSRKRFARALPTVAPLTEMMTSTAVSGVSSSNAEPRAGVVRHPIAVTSQWHQAFS